MQVLVQFYRWSQEIIGFCQPSQKLKGACVLYARHTCFTPQPLLADLPSQRVRENLSFCHIEVVYEGSFLLKEGHFISHLIGELLVAISEAEVEDIVTSHLNRWKLLRQCYQMF